MNLSKYDLRGLAMLWQVSGGNPMLLLQIEAEINNRVNDNNQFPKERLFQINKIANHSLTISFLPATESFRIYGKGEFSCDLILTDEEIEQIILNLKAAPQITSNGYLKARQLAGNLNAEQQKNLQEVGFNTRHISEILHV